MPRPDPPMNFSSVDEGEEGGIGGERQRKTPKGLRHIEKVSKRFVLDPVVSAMKLMTDSNGEENEKDVSPRADTSVATITSARHDDMDDTSDRKSVGVIDKFEKKNLLKKRRSVMEVVAATLSKEETLDEPAAVDCIPGDFTSLLDRIVHIPTAASLATSGKLTVAVGDSLLPLCSNIEKRQQLANVGLHSGVEYVVCAIEERKDVNGKDDLLVSMKLSYPLGPQFQSKGPVTILASDVPVFTLRTKTMTQGVLKHEQSTTFDINKGVKETITVDENSLLQQITLPSVTVVASEYNDICFMGIGSILTVVAIHIWSYTESMRANQFPLSVVSIFTGIAFLLGFAIGRRSFLDPDRLRQERHGGEKAGLNVVRRLDGSRRSHPTSQPDEEKGTLSLGPSVVLIRWIASTLQEVEVSSGSGRRSSGVVWN